MSDCPMEMKCLKDHPTCPTCKTEAMNICQNCGDEYTTCHPRVCEQCREEAIRKQSAIFEQQMEADE